MKKFIKASLKAVTGIAVQAVVAAAIVSMTGLCLPLAMTVGGLVALYTISG